MNFIAAWAKDSIPWFILLAVMFVIGYWTGYQDRPQVIDTMVRLANPIDLQAYDLPPATFRSIPKVTIIEAHRVDTVTTERIVRVPVVIERERIIDRNPIHIEDRYVYLRSWNTQDLQWEVDRFAIPKQRWSTELYALTEVNHHRQVSAGLGASVGYHNLSVHASAVMDLHSYIPQGRVTLKLRL